MNRTKPQSKGLEASVDKILDHKAEQAKALALKVRRLKKRIAELSPQELRQIIESVRSEEP